MLLYKSKLNMDLIERIIANTYYIKTRLKENEIVTDWEAVSLSSNRRFVLHILNKPDSALDAKKLEAFKETLSILRVLSTEYVEGVFECDAYEGHTYFATELITAPSLLEFFPDPRELPQKEALRTAHRIANTLEGLHARGVYHGHLDPRCVHAITSYEGVRSLKISGFYWSALERLSGQKLKELAAESEEAFYPAADILAVGAILYWLLTGALLPAGSKKGGGSPSPSAANPEVLGEVDAIVAKAVDPDKERRYQDISELGEDLLNAVLEYPLRHASLESRADAEAEAEGGGEPAQPEAEAEAPLPKKRAAAKNRKEKAERRPQPTGGGSLREVAAGYPPTANLRKEISAFKQRFFDLFIPRGCLLLLDKELDDALPQKLRWMEYFRDYLRYNGGLFISIAPPAKMKSWALLDRLFAAYQREWAAAQEEEKNPSVAASSQPLGPPPPPPPALKEILAAESTESRSALSLEAAEKLFWDLNEMLQGLRKPLAILVYDAENWDPGSVRLLAAAAPRLIDRPLLFLGALYPED